MNGRRTARFIALTLEVMPVMPALQAARSRLIPALLLAALGTACQRQSPASDLGRENEVTQMAAVEVVQARTGALPLTERLTGTVRAAGEVGIFAEVSAPIAEVYVDNGDDVRKGDPLVRLRPPGAQSQLQQARSSLNSARAEVEQARATLREAEAQLTRIQLLAERGLVSRVDLDTQRTRAETARAALARAEAQVGLAQATVAERAEVRDQTIVRAPISGRVGQRNAEVGMRVDLQTPLFVIGSLDRMRVEVPVTQEILAGIRVGQPVEIRPGGRSGTPIAAQVSRISPFLQEASLSAEVEIDVPNESGRLVPGMFVTVDIAYGESEQATIVPASAVHTHTTTGERGVYVSSVTPEAVTASTADEEGGGLSPDTVRLSFRPVEIVAEGAQTTGIAGVRPGEWVVVVGQHLLSAQSGDGDPQARIRVIEWERILDLQALQRQDVLRQFMERQQQLAVDTASP
jgi:RND family efflux transporter MFP subunit